VAWLSLAAAAAGAWLRGWRPHLMAAPLMLPAELKLISTYLPKREELLLRTVLALPNASSSGLDSST
jgi:hypothetical protein